MPTVLIAGANRGIGLEFARQYRADGWDVVAGCRKPDEAADLKAIAGVEVQAVDVGDDASVKAFAAAVGSRPLDVVIANAGIYGAARQMKLADLDFTDWLQVMNVNTLGPVRVAAAFAENLRASKGKLVAVSSLFGSVTDSSGSYYSYRASKAALNMAFKSVALELKDAGVVAMVLHPGHVATDMGGPTAPTTPEQSVSGMRGIIAALTPDDAATFRAFDGRTLPW